METYKVTDPSTGKTVSLVGDSEPTEQELNNIFKSVHGDDNFQSQAVAPQQEEAQGIDYGIPGLRPAGSNPLMQGASAALQTLGLQPQTNPLEAARNLAMGPSRLSQTFGEGSQAAGEMTAEELGRRGVNPYVAASAGMVASVATDPRSYVPTGLPEKQFALKPVKGKPSMGARFKEMRTGVSARSFDQLRRDPGAFFSRTPREVAGKAVGAAKERAGINLGVTSDIESLTAENLARARTPATVAKTAQDQIVEKLQRVSGSPNPIQAAGITPDEASTALSGVNDKLAKLERSGGGPASPSFQQWSAIKTQLQRILEEVAPEVRQANQDFSRVALRDKFMQPLPVNQNTTFSKVAMGVTAPLAGGVGASLAGSPGAVGAVATAMAVRSPFVAGLGTAARGYLDKVLDPVLTETARLATRRALITNYVTKYGQTKNQ